MNHSELPKELEKFIGAEIQSIEQLEILLLLSADQGKSWTSQAVYEQVKSSHGSVIERLKELRSKGYIEERQGLFHYKPQDLGIADLVEALRRAYKEKPVRIVEAIYNKPPDSVQEFAKAFRLRKDS